jgi:hypothetical protein
LDEFYSTVSLKLRQRIDVPEFPQVTVSCRKNHESRWFQAEEHLFENIEIQEVVVDKASGCDKVVCVFEILWDSVYMGVLTKL